MSSILQFLFLLSLFLACQTSNQAGKDAKLWESARKEIARRTREYIKRNPLSPELQAFIEELKEPKRRKRQDHNDMYAIQNGEVVPLNKLEEQLLTESNLGENFTVVPLIIPIALENNVTHLHRETTEDDLQEPSSERAVLGRGRALESIKQENERERKSDKEESQKEESKTEETVVDSLINDRLKSTSESSDLNKVLEDVQNLIVASKKGRGSSKEGALCNVVGYWDSESGGMTFHITKEDGMPVVKMRPTEPPSEDGFIGKDNWNVTAQIPFPQSAQIIISLTAYKGRRVALFLGECRVCDGSETITGDWLVGRTSSDCKDQKASHSFMSDVFRKNNVETLREAHMKKMSCVTTEKTTEYK